MNRQADRTVVGQCLAAIVGHFMHQIANEKRSYASFGLFAFIPSREQVSRRNKRRQTMKRLMSLHSCLDCWLIRWLVVGSLCARKARRFNSALLPGLSPTGWHGRKRRATAYECWVHPSEKQQQQERDPPLSSRARTTAMMEADTSTQESWKCNLPTGKLLRDDPCFRSWRRRTRRSSHAAWHRVAYDAHAGMRGGRGLNVAAIDRELQDANVRSPGASCLPKSTEQDMYRSTLCDG